MKCLYISILITLYTLPIIPFTNACPQPNTVMIKFPHTVIADIAVSGPLGSEDQAGLTELESIELLFIEIQVVPPIFLRVDGDILLVYLLFYISLIDLFSNDMKVNLLWLELCLAQLQL
jgi:hypothetical protein